MRVPIKGMWASTCWKLSQSPPHNTTLNSTVEDSRYEPKHMYGLNGIWGCWGCVTLRKGLAAPVEPMNLLQEGSRHNSPMPSTYRIAVSSWSRPFVIVGAAVVVWDAHTYCTQTVLFSRMSLQQGISKNVS